MTDLGVVVIGRNEGERLLRCLRSVAGRAGAVVYVDSGSTDGSVEAARALGAEVVLLDPAVPFTAARARNAGLERLVELRPVVERVQFVDGDCERRADQPRQAHPPVPEPVDGDRPEPLFEELAVVRPVVLQQQTEEPDAGRVLVRVALRQRRADPRSRPLAQGVLRTTDRQVNRSKSQPR